MGKPKRFNAYDGDVEASRRVIENYGRDRQIFSTGSSFRSAPNQPNIATTAIGTGSTGVFGIGDPIILHEEDLGDVGLGTSNGTAINVDWSLANKFLCVVKGAVTFTFINTPPNFGFVQQMVLECRQDSTGGHSILFADTFENDHTPIIGKEPDEYNVWAFFASNRSTGEPVFSFNTFQSTALIVALSDEDSPLNFASTITPAVTFRMPYPMIVTKVKADLTTTASSGGFTCDIHEAGTTILGSKITIDDSDDTSESAGTPPSITDNELANNAKMELFLDQKDGGGTARGVKITIFGYIS